MVFFVCGSCGTAIKKNQVSKHYFRCRFQSVSCMDCSKEFFGNDFEGHTSCVSEDKKYGGINFVEKENKGQKKQEEWITLLKDKIASTNNIKPQLKNLFDRILQFDNVPRKKGKFINFLKSNNFRNEALVEEAWKYFEEVQQMLSNKQNNQSNKQNQANSDSQKMEEDVNSTPSAGSADAPQEAHVEPKRKSKKERKEERQKKQTKVQKKDKRKRLVEDDDGEDQEIEKPKKKKKKRAEQDDKANQENEEPANGLDVSMGEADEQALECASSHSPFKWKKAIATVLKDAPEEGMKMKKLKRKLVALYCESNSEAAHRKSDVEIEALISKKLQRRNDKYIVVKDRVKLRSSS